MAAAAAILADYLEVPTKIGPYGPKLNKSAIIRHKRLLLSLRKVQSNLSFAKLSLKNAFMMTASDKNWHMTPAEIADFSTKATDRLMLMCRHLTQALCKTPPPRWAQEVCDEQQSLLEDKWIEKHTYMHMSTHDQHTYRCVSARDIYTYT